MATRVGMKPEPKPVTAPAPVVPVEEPETILPDVTEELERAVKPKKVTKRPKKTTK